MTLKINLKPREAVYIGTTSVTVLSEGKVTLAIDGDAPILRSSERISEPPADHVAARLQYVIQQMFLAQDLAAFHAEYFALAHRLGNENAEMAKLIAATNFHLVQGELYQALKSARKLVEGFDQPTAQPRPKSA
ncbi:MAG: hypothetical protein KKH72_02005 [Alphaproteobacteria bacterium]|nr:hypothetical protein [Alphaproteobacteria bacterium]